MCMAMITKKINKYELLLDEKYRSFLRLFKDYLKGLRLSKSTVNTYCNFIVFFLIYMQFRPTQSVDHQYLQRYIEALIRKRRYSISSHRQLVSALKHFGERFPEFSIEPELLKRPHKNRALPTVLSQHEVIDLIRVTRNIKHRTILALMYSAGLRVSEVLALTLKEIDIDRRQVVVRQSKNRKDRYIVLAESLIPLLINYVNSYQPKHFLFEGEKGLAYSATSIRAFLRRSCKRAGIRKRVTPHTLRHSYATHLIEQGVNLRLVQELLGHAKPETTMIYTHVAKKDLLQVKSPLDNALLKIQPADNNQLNIRLSGNLKG